MEGMAIKVESQNGLQLIHQRRICLVDFDFATAQFQFDRFGTQSRRKKISQPFVKKNSNSFLPWTSHRKWNLEARFRVQRYSDRASIFRGTESKPSKKAVKGFKQKQELNLIQTQIRCSQASNLWKIAPNGLRKQFHNDDEAMMQAWFVKLSLDVSSCSTWFRLGKTGRMLFGVMVGRSCVVSRMALHTTYIHQVDIAMGSVYLPPCFQYQ